MPDQPIANADANAQQPTFFERVIDGFNELKTLRVSTYIGTVQPNTSLTVEDLQDGQGQDVVLSKLNINDAMLSKVDMLTGDITTAMTNEFRDNSALREYHSLREQQAHEIVKRNVEVLKSVGKMIIDFVEDNQTFKKQKNQ